MPRPVEVCSSRCLCSRPTRSAWCAHSCAPAAPAAAPVSPNLRELPATIVAVDEVDVCSQYRTCAQPALPLVQVMPIAACRPVPSPTMDSLSPRGSTPPAVRIVCSQARWSRTQSSSMIMQPPAANPRQMYFCRSRRLFSAGLPVTALL